MPDVGGLHARCLGEVDEGLDEEGAHELRGVLTTCESVSEQELKERDAEARPSKTYAPDVVVRVGHELLGRRWECRRVYTATD
jgi:hypothetical protein